MNEVLTDAAIRLLECMQDPGEARVLGPAIMREITYRVLLRRKRRRTGGN